MKKIFVDRINRMEVMFRYFAANFLAYMNTLLYSYWDVQNIANELAQNDGGNALDFMEKHGRTGKEAYEITLKIMSPLLAHIKK